MERNLKNESVTLCLNILEHDGRMHSYSFHMFRKIFQSKINDDDKMFGFWYINGDFKNMRLYKYLTELGYRKDGTVLAKIKG